VTSGAAPRRFPTWRRMRFIASLTGALAALGAGWTVAVLGVGHPVPITTVLVLVPLLAVAVPTRRLEPLARVVLAIGWVLALNTVVAQTMLSFAVWNVPVGVLVVTGTSVVVWVGVELATWRADRNAADRATPTASEVRS